MPAWLREPLLHFLILGAALFVADRLIYGDIDAARTIVVGPEVTAEARAMFQQARGRPPNEDELQALRRTWLDNELLYRHGMKMQVERGDDTIRQRVIFKALSLIDMGLKPPAIDEAGLREWFEANRQRYEEPQRFDFQEAVLGGERSRARAEALAARLNAADTPGEIDAGLRVYKSRPRESIVQTYGEPFTAAMEALVGELGLGRWAALPHGAHWRVLRVDAVTQAQPARFEVLSGIVLRDWTDEAATKQRTDAVRALEREYIVRYQNEAVPGAADPPAQGASSIAASADPAASEGKP